MASPDDVDVVRVVYEAPTLTLGEFHCEPGDRRWSEENRTDEGHFVVFPWTPVRIAQEGREPVVATPNHVMFYNRDQIYRRAIVSERGDHCVFVLVSPQIIEEIARTLVPELSDPLAPFPRGCGPSAANTYLAHKKLLNRLKAGSPWEDLAVQERLYELVLDAIVGTFGSARPNPEPRRVATRAAHAELVEEAKRVLSLNLGDRLTMEELAASLFTSPFHLARVFRSRTGFSLNAYRTQLRLRSSLEQIFEAKASLTDIATDFGFSSLSHFTDSFHRAFGVAPSAAREASRHGSKTRRILEAAPQSLS